MMAVPGPDRTVLQMVREYEAVGVFIEQRNNAQAQADQWQDTAEKCAEEAERLRADNGYLQRQIEEFKAVHTRLTEQLVEARKQIPEPVDTGGKT